jgi:hypothetical protein
MQKATAEWNLFVELVLQVLPTEVLHETGLDSVVRQCLQLGRGVCGVAVLQHPLEVHVISVGTP